MFDTMQRVLFSGDDLEQRLNPLMAALLAVGEADDKVTDIDVAASITERQVVVTMTVGAGDPAEALSRAFATLGAAIQVIGGDWDTARVTMHAAPALSLA